MILVATTGATTTSAPNTTLYNMAVETIGDMMDSFPGIKPLALRLCTDEDKGIVSEPYLKKICQNIIYWALKYIILTAFHDCVGSDGCDGCLNTDQSANDGLGKVVRKLYTTKASDSSYDVSLLKWCNKFSNNSIFQIPTYEFINNYIIELYI